MELILVVFALFAAATPFATVFLLWRQHKLRQQLLKLTELSMEVSDGLRRDLQDLKRQVESGVGVPRTAVNTASGAPAAAPHLAEKAAPTVAPVAPIVHKAAEVAPVPAAVVPPVTTPPEVARPPLPVPERAQPVAEKAEKPAPFAAAHVPPKAAQPALEKSAAEVQQKEVPRKAEEKPGAPAIAPSAIASTTEPKPPRPAAQAPVVPTPKPEPPAPAAAPPHTAVVTPKTPPVPASPAPSPVHPTAARVVEAPQFAPLRSPAASATRPGFPPPRSYTHPASKPTAQQRMKSVFAFEELLGTNWLNKIGVVLVVIGVATFGIYELSHLGPVFRVAVSYAVGAAFLAAGILLEKNNRYRIFSYALIGGGWALLFFTTFALRHVTAMRVLSADGTALISETADLILMLAVALAMVAHTLRYRSQVVTGLAFLLAYGTVSLSQNDVYSLSSGVILAIGLVAIVIKMDWFELEVFGILSSYGNHIYWLYRQLGPNGAHGQAFPEYHASTAILLFYWIIYRISYVLRKTKTPAAEHVSTAAALLNTLLLLGTMKFQSVHPELAFWALLIIGAAEFSLGQLPITRRRREAFVVLSVLGAALMIGAVPFKYSGNHLAVLWLVGAEVLLVAGVLFGEVVFRRLGLLTGLLVGLHLVLVDFQELMARRRMNEDVVLDVGIVFALSAAVFYLNALFVGWRWRQFFADAPDEQFVISHSYVGGFATASAAWALCSGDWTAVAFAGVMFSLAVLGRRLKSFHLQVQYGFLGLLSLFRVAVINLHSDVPLHTHITNRLITLPIIAAAFYITAKFAATNEDNDQQTLRWLFALSGTGLLTALIYFEVPELWQPLAAIVFAIALLEVGQWIRYTALCWHAHLLTGLAVLAAVTADPGGIQRWHDIPFHAFGALPVVAGAYWIARRVRVPDAAHVTIARTFYTWAGTGVMTWVLYEATPAPWIAVSWIGFAIALALVMRQIGYKPLAWQANAVAACAVVRAFTFNLDLGQALWPGFSLRLVTISTVAAGLYFLSRKATIPDSASRRVVAYLHTVAATGLLTLLAWREAPAGWLVAVWAVFALVLALVDRRFEVEDLRWQAHALAALTMVRSVGINLYVLDTWHGISVRLLSLSIVAVIFYALARIIRMPESLRQRDFHHIYSWAASTLVSLLMWYELNSVSVAVGWAVFGLVLFEYGLWRKTRQFRFQAYIALAASFGRIFFANLTADTPGEFWGPRMYTVLPIALILFFVYAQLSDANAQDDRAAHVDMLFAYLGTGTVAALIYFQLPNEWIVTAWAVVVFVLFGLSLLLDRPIFLHQALLLTVGTCTRGVMHNLFGASYFTGGEWVGKYFVLGAAIAALLACVPFAFRWRDRMKTKPSGNWVVAIVRRPEQFMFFAPVLLLTMMLAVKMRSGMITVSCGVEALGILIFAFIINERSYRLTGLILLLASFAKILLFDMWRGGWTWHDRWVTWIIVGGAMILAGFLYTRYGEKIRQLL